MTAGFNSGLSGPVVFATSEQAPLSGDQTGNFRTTCEPVAMKYADPIIFPRQDGASHLHTFFGNTSVDHNSTNASLLAAGNSACRGGTINRSSYWVPSMIDTRNDTAVMPASQSDFYYKTGYRGVRPADVRPFPAGLRMIAGDARNTGAGDPYAPNPWRFHCASNESGTRSTTIPNCGVGDTLVQEIFFPQCWNGVDVDSPDHKSHMAYPTGNPACPTSHPVALPEITFKIKYLVTEPNQTRNWRLSSDQPNVPAGYSSHGDWINGWDAGVMKAWVENCLNTARDCHSHLIGDGRAMGGY